jgi:acetyl-CoA acetyltransferase
MRDAVIVSTARTPIGKAYRGAFNATPSATLAGHAIKHAVERAGILGSEVDDVLLGSALQQGVQGLNIGRLAAWLHCGPGCPRQFQVCRWIASAPRVLWLLPRLPNKSLSMV